MNRIAPVMSTKAIIININMPIVILSWFRS